MQNSFENLEQARCRQLVITAREHARWAARKEECKDLKLPMVEMMLVWLENPALFETWLRAKHRNDAGARDSDR